MAKRDWSRMKVRLALEQAGYERLIDVELKFDLRHGVATDTLARPNKAGEEAIAAIIGVRPADIWPSRYDANGERLKPQPPMNYIRRALERHGQNGRAA